MKSDKQNEDKLFIDDNETEQDLLLALSDIPDEEIAKINREYENNLTPN